MSIALVLMKSQNVDTMVQSQGRTGPERRTDRRYRMNAPALVKSKTAGIAAGLVLEASSGGLCLSLPFAVPLNSEIEVRLEGKAIVGIIRNCVCIRATEFHVGVQVSPSIDNQVLAHLRLFKRAKALNLVSPRRASKFWSSPA